MPDLVDVGFIAGTTKRNQSKRRYLLVVPVYSNEVQYLVSFRFRLSVLELVTSSTSTPILQQIAVIDYTTALVAMRPLFY